MKRVRGAHRGKLKNKKIIRLSSLILRGGARRIDIPRTAQVCMEGCSFTIE